MKSLNEVANIIKSKNYIYILTHMFPDGDTLGSAYALCRALQIMGKKAKVVYSGKMSSKYEFMKCYVNDEDFYPEFVMSVDVASMRLIDDSLAEYKNNIELCIDHHISNEYYADVTFVDPMASANAEIIYSLITYLGVKIDKKIAECLYVGISTDTGCFKYSNVTSKTHMVVSDLITKDIELERLNTDLFITENKKMISLKKMIYNIMEYHFEDRCALIYVTKDMMERCGISDDEIDGIASIPKGIEGVQIGVTLRERDDNIYKVSVRTSGLINSAKLCSEYGGGGHIHAGGCEIKGTIEEVKSQFLSTIREQLGW